jgi:hypothetical protein
VRLNLAVSVRRIAVNQRRWDDRSILHRRDEGKTLLPIGNTGCEGEVVPRPSAPLMMQGAATHAKLWSHDLIVGPNNGRQSSISNT